MTAQSLAVLQAALAKHAPLSSARLETLALLITGMLGARTVNLGHMASERAAPVKHASTFRRFQRFFKEVALSPAPGGVGGVGLGRDWAARLIVSLLRLSPPWPLCLDRTHRKIGKREVNVLVLAVVTRRHRLPLMWTLLGRAGNSATAERIALMKRYLARFVSDGLDAPARRHRSVPGCGLGPRRGRGIHPIGNERLGYATPAEAEARIRAAITSRPWQPEFSRMASAKPGAVQ